MGMFIHAVDESGDNYWDTIEMVERKQKDLGEAKDRESWEKACHELGIVARDIIKHTAPDER